MDGFLFPEHFLKMDFSDQTSSSGFKQHLSQQAVSFVQLCDISENRMQQVGGELKCIAGKMKRIRQDTQIMFCLSGFITFFGAVFAEGPKTAKFGLTLAFYRFFAFVGCIVHVVLIIYRISSEIENAEKMNRLTEEFKLLVDPLKNALERVKAACGRFHTSWDRSEALKYTRLEVNILELLFIMNDLKMPTIVPWVKEDPEKYKKVVDEIIRMKKDLQTFYL